jgi:hypothetical protein
MPTYSAGYGGVGSTYAIDEYGISFEFCQSDSLEPFTDAQYDLGAQRAAIRCKAYGIPVRFVTIPRQVGEPPSGFVRHDRCENGAKLGKTDPGEEFNEAKFCARVNHYVAPAPEPPPVEEDDMFSDQDRQALLNQGQALAAMFTWGWWERNIGGLEWRFVKSSGAVYVLAYRVSNESPPQLGYTRHHVPNPYTLAMLGGKPDWSNVVDWTAAQLAKVSEGAPVPDMS